MRITKSQVITALENEPLQAGQWIDDSGDLSFNDCPVCAVGAVMRNSLNYDNYKVNEFSTYCLRATGSKFTPDTEHYQKEALDLINKKSYLGALSVYFEGMSEESDRSFFPSQEQRKELINFVVEYFPDEFEVTV